MKPCFVLSFVLCLSSQLSAQAPAIPKTVPTFCVAKAGADGRTIEVTMGRTVAEQFQQVYTVKVPVTKVVDGKQVTELRDEQRTRTVTKTRFVPATKTFLSEGLALTTVDGRKLDAPATMKRLGKPTRVLLITDGAKLDPYFKDLFTPDTLVLSSRVPRPGQNRPVPPAARRVPATKRPAQ